MNNERLLKVLLSPIISEKSANMADKHRQYAFRVATDATKREIGKAVEKMFDVEVQRVTVVNTKGKSKRFGQIQGRRANTRKAYVRLKPGHDIDFATGA